MTTHDEVKSFQRFIFSSIDRLMAIVNELTTEELTWIPPAGNANSISALANHVMANAEENLLGVLCGQPVNRQRQDEFTPAAGKDELQQRWVELRTAIETALVMHPEGSLVLSRLHPRRGDISGRDVLIVVARHAAEHLGQVELTRDLLGWPRTVPPATSPS